MQTENKQNSFDEFKAKIQPFVGTVKDIARDQLKLFKLIQHGSIKVTDAMISDYELFVRIYHHHSNKNKIRPTIETQLLWIVHALNPKHYFDDNQNAFGELIPVAIVKNNNGFVGNSECFAQEIEKNVDPLILKEIKTKINAAPFIQKLDLKQAVIRQFKFIDKINRIQKSENITDLQIDEAVERYFKFVYLMKLGKNKDTKDTKDTKKLYVPTLDIDLIWHSHQIDAVKYHEMSKLIFENVSVISHDDDIEEETLKKYKAETRSKWNDVFGNDAYGYFRGRAFGKKVSGQIQKKRKLELDDDAENTEQPPIKRRKISVHDPEEIEMDYDKLKQRLNEEIESKNKLETKLTKCHKKIKSLKRKNKELNSENEELRIQVEQCECECGDAGCGGCG